MSKSTQFYWNPLHTKNSHAWRPVEGLEGIAEEVTLSEDPETREYTRLTRFLPGADTSVFGAKSHAYPEEVLIVGGRLYDAAFDQWLEVGCYASRKPFERHGRSRLILVASSWKSLFPKGRPDFTSLSSQGIYWCGRLFKNRFLG